ncbi:Chloroplast envelope membrane protein [Actinidia chinensis var. chinensis]|uniref:Chloroplast envelope membrane protein n=1 Tax=Actinidia chinensis var. chinensis TaxID=1590841 RepID=A0A2R6Q3Z1_ACTCC|nr:Chloroplast envelope membrane protein [Actinidia chinensis var. chinensis]
MSTSMVLCENLIFFNQSVSHKSMYPHNLSNIAVQLSGGRRRLRIFAPNAKNSHSGKRSWWKKFFFDDEGNWLGLKDEDILEEEESEGSSEEEVSEGEKFEAWKRRAEAIIELREAQADLRNQENRRWEDWLVDETNDVNSSSWDQDWNDRPGKSREDALENPSELIPERGLVKSLRDLVLGTEDEGMLYEDRVFRYASINSAKFLAVLIVIPWALDFLVHDYVLMPFLDRYVKTVPLAEEMLDVRRNQKLEIVKELKLEKARFRLEVEIGKSPPLSDEELWLELQHKALELRDEWRLENRRAFANILSDMVFGISLFILLYFNQNKVALLKFTGYKILNNISDSGKAFLIILFADIFLGYHSEAGWQTLLEVLIEHYGLEIDQGAITIFIGLVPVFMDLCVKLWLFKILPRLSPRVANILREMKRH